MPDQKRIVKKGKHERTVITDDGRQLRVPREWSLLPPGDATLTRRTKTAGPHWLMQSRRSRRTFSDGIWAPTETVDRIRNELEAERSTEAYAKKREKAAVRRDKQQTKYVDSFEHAVLQFLNFHEAHAQLGSKLARAVAEHATPIGSGTVARTKRIPVEQRASAAVIAWMRHQTTGYDDMKIARVKGRRREVRRELAARSRQLLDVYRKGRDLDPAQCSLRQALEEGT